MLTAAVATREKGTAVFATFRIKLHNDGALTVGVSKARDMQPSGDPNPGLIPPNSRMLVISKASNYSAVGLSARTEGPWKDEGLRGGCRRTTVFLLSAKKESAMSMVAVNIYSIPT
jgi:hypothetical protein